MTILTGLDEIPAPPRVIPQAGAAVDRPRTGWAMPAPAHAALGSAPRRGLVAQPPGTVGGAAGIIAPAAGPAGCPG
jgi:hypothetical protein